MKPALIVKAHLGWALAGDDDAIERPPPFALRPNAIHDVETVHGFGFERDTDRRGELAPRNPGHILRSP